MPADSGTMLAIYKDREWPRALCPVLCPRGLPTIPPWLNARRPGSARSPHTAAVHGPQSSVPTRPPAYDSRDGRVAREPRHHPRALRAPTAAVGPDDRSPSAAWQPPPASNAFAVPRAAPSVAPVLVGSRRYAPSPWTPQPSMKADISTLLKQDILTLQLHKQFLVLTKDAIRRKEKHIQVCFSTSSQRRWSMCI